MKSRIDRRWWMAVVAFGAVGVAVPIPTVTAADEEPRQWQGIPGLERTEAGRLFATWYTGGPREPDPENTVVLSISDDGGETFSEPVEMAGPKDGARAYDPALWIDPRGRLWLIYNRANKEESIHDVHARRCEDPDADDPEWSDEFRVGFDEAPFSFRMNKPTVLESGTWVLPVTHAREPSTEWFARPDELHGVALSTDEGETWTLHGEVESPDWALENMIVELQDGRLWMLIRTGSGVLWQSFSSDGGETWEDGSPTTIENPGARFFIRRLESGNLLLVDHHDFTGRSHLTAQISEDDGETWSEGLVLDERSPVSYPDGVQDRDGLIWIIYDRDRRGAGEILVARFREEDAGQGEDVSGEVRLKQVINRLGD
jgi:predicted neuraminidase